MKATSIVAVVDNEIRTSPPWDTYRCVKPGERVWALPATNMPKGSPIRWWISPFNKKIDWAVDADGPYGVPAYLEDLSPTMPDDKVKIPVFEDFFESYMQCLLWTGSDPQEVSLDENYDTDDIAEEAKQEMRRDCWDFFSMNMYTLCHTPEHYNAERAGHDFALTRNGHGAGFWDRGLDEEGEDLTEASKVYGSQDLYVGDDGRLYVC